MSVLYMHDKDVIDEDDAILQSIYNITGAPESGHNKSPTTVQSLIRELAEDLGNRTGCFARQRTLHAESKTFCPTSLPSLLLYQWHYAHIACIQTKHLSTTVYKRYEYCLFIAIRFCTLVRNCCLCIERSQAKDIDTQRTFLANVALTLVVIDIIRGLSKTLKSDQLVLVMTDRYLKRVRTEPMSDSTLLHIACHFKIYWDRSNGAPTYVLACESTKIFTSFFETICAFSESYHLTALAYCKKSNRLS